MTSPTDEEIAVCTYAIDAVAYHGAELSTEELRRIRDLITRLAEQVKEREDAAAKVRGIASKSTEFMVRAERVEAKVKEYEGEPGWREERQELYAAKDRLYEAAMAAEAKVKELEAEIGVRTDDQINQAFRIQDLEADLAEARKVIGELLSHWPYEETFGGEEWWDKHGRGK